MGLMSGVFDSDLIQPVCKIKENLSILTLGKYEHFRVDFIEPISVGPGGVVDTVATAGATTIAANATINKQIVAILQLNKGELLQVRWEPLDNVEGLIWELSGQQKNASRGIHSRVDINTRLRDRNLAGTQFFILGEGRDMNLETRNPLGYAQPSARFIFWAYRYILTPWTELKHFETGTLSSLRNGDLETVRQLIGTTTWISAEGRQS